MGRNAEKTGGASGGHVFKLVRNLLSATLDSDRHTRCLNTHLRVIKNRSAGIRFTSIDFSLPVCEVHILLSNHPLPDSPTWDKDESLAVIFAVMSGAY